MASIAELTKALTDDPLRQDIGFSSEIAEANEAIWASGDDEERIEQILGDWIYYHQPCLFGKIASKLGLISYCILTPYDLRQSDDHIFQKLQSKKRKWTRKAFDGESSNFVILASSREMAMAEPRGVLLDTAIQLCSLYLDQEIKADQIYLDDIYLEIPGKKKSAFKWKAGINYFGTQADRRWWRDHRIPGGIGFSTNSVGHLAKAGRLSNAMEALLSELTATDEDWPTSKIESLDKALEFAMKTIAKASDGVSGKATYLLPIPHDTSEVPFPECPVKLPERLADKNFCEYEGYYHTDITLPSEYFTSVAERPTGQSVHRLDFTYLFDNSRDNSDYRSMATGIQIREGGVVRESLDRISKRSKGRAEVVTVGDEPTLIDALSN